MRINRTWMGFTALVAAALVMSGSPALAADGPPYFVIGELGFDQGWRKEPSVKGLGKSAASHFNPRHVADITGDGRADIVGFGTDGVWAAVALPGNGFGPALFRLNGSFGSAQGWNERDYRFVTDITGDGKADIVAVGRDGVWTAISNGDGSFAEPGIRLGEVFGFSSNSGVGKHGIFAADFDNDNDSDLIAIAERKITVARSNGDGNFSAPFTASSGFDELTMRSPQVVDLNGDGRADILTQDRITVDGISIARAQSNGTFGSFVTAGGRVHEGSPDMVPELIGDVNGDFRPDLVQTRTNLFGDPPGTFLAINRGDGTFFDAIHTNGTDGTWQRDRNQAVLADVTGDRRADLVMFADAGVWVSVSQGNGFGPGMFVLANFGYQQSWRIDKHLRVAANINEPAGTANPKADLIGFGDAGVYVAFAIGDGGFN